MKVSAAESTILELLWRAGKPVPAETVVEMIGEDAGWSPATVRTFLTRLVRKKAAAADQDGRRYLYRPLISREEYARQQGRRLVDRLFDGRITPFVTQLVEREPISREDLEDLKRLIERLDHDR